MQDLSRVSPPEDGYTMWFDQHPDALSMPIVRCPTCERTLEVAAVARSKQGEMLLLLWCRVDDEHFEYRQL